MQKTCYRISGGRIESTQEAILKPQSLLQSLSSIESGRVYEIMYQGEVQKKTAKDYDNFLIYVIKQEVSINEEAHIMTLFKDITFGVLYEQIKAKEQLQNMIDDAVYQNILNPLNDVMK